MRLSNDIDIHTHSGPVRPDAVLCVDPVEAAFLPPGDGQLSVGIHPWNAGKTDSEVWRRLEGWLDDNRVVAVGEIGLDRLRGPAMDIQTGVFESQALMAAERHLPVVVHCVRATEILLEIRKKLFPVGHDSEQWILHGFRGKPTLAEQLLKNGIDLSFGKIRNEESYALTPPSRRYYETDTNITPQ